MHIGLKIKEVTELRGITKAELGRRLNMSSTNIHKIFKRESIDTGLLDRLSDILEHDFFQYYIKSAIVNDLSAVFELETCKEKLKMSEKINSLLEEKIMYLENRKQLGDSRDL
jgi:transcriptional regulator with XRE-family HTH domain